MVILRKVFYRVVAGYYDVATNNITPDDKWNKENLDYMTIDGTSLIDDARRILVREMRYDGVPFNDPDRIRVIIVQKGDLKCELEDDNDISLDYILQDCFHYFNCEDENVKWEDYIIFGACDYEHGVGCEKIGVYVTPRD